MASKKTARFRVFRFDNPNGTTKDWSICALANKVIIHYGRTGSKPRTHVVPLAKCDRGNPEIEANKRVDEQLKQGYYYVEEADEAIPSDGEPRTASPDTDPPASQQTPDPAPSPRPTCLYWRYAEDDGPEADAIVAELVAVAKVLKRHKLADAVLRKHKDLRYLELTDAVTLDSWSIGVGTTTGTNQINVHVGRGSGSVTPSKHGEAPVLLLTALAKRWNGFSLANEAGDELPLEVNPAGHPEIDDVGRVKAACSELEILHVPLTEQMNDDASAGAWFF